MAAVAISDPGAHLEQQAKERLTGGVILVVLLVLLVPELLTGPRPVVPAAPAQPDHAPMRSYTMELGPAAHANSGPIAASTAVVPAAPPRASEPPALSSAPIKPPPEVTRAAKAARPPPLHAPAHGAAAWTVQLGTFSNRENAARLVASLKAHGFSAAVSEAPRNGHKLFRVRVGTERDRAAAQKLQGRLRAAGERGGEVIQR